MMDYCVSHLHTAVQTQQHITYDCAANTDDGSCIPFIYGCIIQMMHVYDASANTADGSVGMQRMQILILNDVCLYDVI